MFENQHPSNAVKRANNKKADRGELKEEDNKVSQTKWTEKKKTVKVLLQ